MRRPSRQARPKPPEKSMRSQEKPGKRASDFFRMSCTKTISSTNPFLEREPFHTVPALFLRSSLSLQCVLFRATIKSIAAEWRSQLENSGKEGNTMAVIGIDLGTTNSLAAFTGTERRS